MNLKETARLAEVLRQLRFGPGNGWRETLAGRDGEEAFNVERREAQLRLWLDTWVLPPLVDVTARYGKGRA